MTEIVSLADIKHSRVDAALHGATLSIGNFDGVHLGHAALLGRTRAMADRLGGPAAACLFDPHPIAILRPDATPMRLTTVAERARRMAPLGIDYLVVCKTTPTLLGLTATEFFEQLVRDNLRCGGMVEGENFCFGRGREGDVSLLVELCAANKMEFEAVPLRANAGEMISSTRIRDALAQGDVGAAAEMMATPHRLTGEVVPGDRRGRTIGFPTANLDSQTMIVPAPGVYAGIATLDDKPLQAAVHIGESPTFAAGTPNKVEVHLLDFEGDIYGRTLSVDFISRVRDIARFDSAETLAKQLASDVQTVRQLLATHQQKDAS